MNQNKNNEMPKFWWSIPIKQLTNFFHVDTKHGLNERHIEESRSQYGSNALVASKPMSIATLILEGVKEPMMILLLSVAGLSFIFGKLIEAFAMIFVVAAYILVEFINKYRTDRIMMRLKNLAAPTTRVIREGKEQTIPTKDIVVGDILILSQGALIPADARLLTSNGLLLNEASLTGESLPVHKDAQAQVSQHAALADRVNCVFSGTTVLSGEGTAIITAVGQQSEFGKIAVQVQKAEKEKTVLQELMTKLAKTLAIFALIMSALIPAVGFLRGLNLQEMILTWLSLTFLMIPGQPPIIITMALALAAFELARKQVIVKRLRGAEVMGQVTAIISDKTGTITENKMKVETFILEDDKAYVQLPKDIQEKVALALPRYSNDPTDKAVRDALAVHVQEQPIDFKDFSDKQPWRDIVYKKDGGELHVIAASPEIVVAASTLNPEIKNKLLEHIKKEAEAGKRVVSYALSQTNELKNLTFLALAVLHDPVRPGVKEAIERLEQAHVATYIVTGDHPATAKSIAHEIGISGEIITGDQLATMNDAAVLKTLEHPHIFARTDPLQKLRLVKVLQSHGEIVAAIGDGINDSPALKTAQVGIAMGQIGTDLAKEVSDLILTDDNYVHIPDAIAIGRKALDNFKKGLTYYLSAKSILLIVFLVPLALAMPFPFTPIQIILIELLMDLASSTIFVTEAAEPDSMKKPAARIKNFLNRSLIFTILKNCIWLALGIIGIYLYLYKTHGVKMAQTAAFVAWLLGHILLALNLKQEKMPLIKQGFFSNYFAIIWLCGMICFSMAITCIPFFYPYFNTTWLPLKVWIGIILTICVATFWIEVKKIITYKFAKKKF
jgi:Ca2+-transporting ATPase